MNNAQRTVALSTPRVAHVKRASCAPRWPAIQRAALAQKLSALGTSITEVSDVRERRGLPRLSDSTNEARAVAHHILTGARGKAALASVREERALLTSGLETTERLDISSARALLGLRGAPSELRLGDLRALYAQAQLCRLAREAL